MKRIWILLLTVCSISSCCVYKKYEPVATVPNGIFGTDSVILAADMGNSLASVTWRDFFTDSDLQVLIDSVLSRNRDLKSAHLNVKQAEATLLASKLAYAPSINLSPRNRLSCLGGAHTQSYSFGISGDCPVDVSGRLTTTLRRNKALTEQLKDAEQATRIDLIAKTAQLYYQLMLYDRQLEVLTQTDSIWEIGLDMQRLLLDAGLVRNPAVRQLEASRYDIEVRILELKVAISRLEHALCLLLADVPHSIERGTLDSISMPERFAVGLPVSILQNRPDVRIAQRKAEAAFYARANAYAQCFPSISISGFLGFQGSSGASVNPVQMAANVVGSLLQPLFAQGRLQAQVKIATARQEQAKMELEQVILKAGVEINEALTKCQLSQDKKRILHKRVAALKEAYEGTTALMDHGKASYIEVLTAQEKLLQAQLGQVANDYDSFNNLLQLYVAVGGGK